LTARFNKATAGASLTPEVARSRTSAVNFYERAFGLPSASALRTMSKPIYARTYADDVRQHTPKNQEAPHKAEPAHTPHPLLPKT